MDPRAALGKNTPTLCMTCDIAFTPTSQPPEAFVVIRGANPAGKHLIVSVLCGPCYQHPNSKQRVVERIRSGMIQDLREIHVGEAGHA
jgi:ABC-type molybdenum transport system ATPase subunit/photorepair protein PhrA